MSPMTMKAARRHCRATAIAAVIATAIAPMWKALPHSLLKYYSNVEYTQHRPHEKIDFFVRLVLFFATARIFFATARKN